MTKRMDLYICKVTDPATGGTVTYPNVRAISKKHADRQARDSFTGLLGVPEGLQERLEVEVALVPRP